MIRTILSVIAAYVVMALTMFLSFTLLYLVLGADGSFQPGRYDVSAAWIIGSYVLGFLAVMLGGYVAVLISKNQNAPLWFGGIVLVVSLLVGYSAYKAGNPHEVRAGNVENMVAMTKAQNPTWLNFLVPFTGLIAAIAGGKLRKVERRY